MAIIHLGSYEIEAQGFIRIKLKVKKNLNEENGLIMFY